MSFAVTLMSTQGDASRAATPWCRPLDNLELAILLQASPWAVVGIRVADLVTRLNALGNAIPLGPIYFHRVSRAAHELVQIKALDALEHPRGVGFRLRPEGFAALVLNQHLCTADPTFDSTEFEIKREIASCNSFALQQLEDLAASIGDIPPPVRLFFEQAEALRVLGQAVVTPELVADAFSVSALLERQLAHVRGLALRAERASSLFEMSPPNIAAVRESILASASESAEAFPELISTLEALASSGWQRTSLRAAEYRYTAYLMYIERLVDLYRDAVPRQPNELFRRPSPSSPPRKPAAKGKKKQ